MRPSRSIGIQDFVGIVPGPVTLVGLVASIPVLTLTALVPAGQVLVAVSLGAIYGAALTALVACLTGARSHGGIGMWDVAGVLAFVGFGAGMVADPDTVLKFFGLT